MIAELVKAVALCAVPYEAPQWRWIVDSDGKYGIYYPGGVFIAVADSREIAKLIVTAVNAYDSNTATIAAQAAEIETLRDVLGKIAEGTGLFSRDPLTHASNTIEAMKELALAALAERVKGDK